MGSTLAAAGPRPTETTVVAPGAERARGLHYGGLVPASRGRCAHNFRVVTTSGPTRCSHGPDPAPADLDVTQYRATSDLLSAGVNATPTQSGTVRCIGDGVSGPRVQAVYAVASDHPDRYSQLASSLATWSGQVDGVFSQSAAESGGDRHVRFVMNPDCSLNIAHVVLSTAGDDNFTNTINELQALGYYRPLTKYLVWMDANVYCGIGEIIEDDTAGASNANNTQTDFARVDSGCWGRSDHLSEAHELMHTFGGVQLSAAHATGHHHCTDESDAMCYVDAAGVTLTNTCPAGHEWLFDCGDDDYYDTNPSSGSYLATHWNAARSQFLDDPNATTTTTTTTTSTTTTTTSPPPTTTTATFTGSLSAKRTKQSFSLTVKAGAVSDALQFSSSGKTKTAASLSLSIYAANGALVLNGSGPSVLRQAATLTAGTYTWQVSGTSSVSFTLTVNSLM